MPKATAKSTTKKKSKAAPRKGDPIFAALENHKKRDRAWLDLEHAREARPRTVKRSDVDRASDAAEKAAWKMARTKPGTDAGAAAMLTYITTDKSTGFFELGETKWHETAFRTVAASLAKIARQ
jgi:hypothetical protein